MTELENARALVVHDWIIPWAGAERVLQEILAVVPRADLVVGVMDPARRNDNAVTRRARETWLAKIPLARSHHRWFVPLHFAAFRGIDTTGYDIVISSSFGFAKAVTPSGDSPHVCYCHSPPRYVWDMSSTYRSLAGPMRGLALRLATPLLARLDRMSADSVTTFVANSHFVSRRIAFAYGRESQVVYPPVTVNHVSKSVPREDFLLVLGRLVAYKRVDLAIRAADRLGKRLIVAGDGPERRALEAMAGPNTTFLGLVDDATAASLMERCAAFVFCAEEDFGIAPVEANGHGAPVIGYGRGGLTESMVPGQTAVFFETASAEAVADAVDRALAVRWDHDAIRANARRFGAGRFRSEFSSLLRSAISEASRQARA